MEQCETGDREDNQSDDGRPDNKQSDVRPRRVKISKVEEIDLDDWQQEIRQSEGNIAIRAGRQTGKSLIISILASEFAANNKNKSIMIISATERQAYLLFSKVENYLYENFKTWIKKGKDRPTKSELKLTNGSIIRCLPTGLDGSGIRGYTIDLLIADEAAFIPPEVFPALTPGLSTKGGRIILLSTPFGKEGYFYDRFNDPDFKTWHVSAEDVAEHRPEPQRTFLKDFHEKEKLRMTKLQYAQEYLGEFVSELRQFFPEEIIKKSCILSRKSISPGKDYYLGCDFARMGDDFSSFEIVEKVNNQRIDHVESILTSKNYTTATFDKILQLDRSYNFSKIGIDAGAGSLGVGILDFLIREPQVKRKIVALNNLSRDLDQAGERKRTLLKEDMYHNLLALMERGFIKLLDDDEVINSLRAIQFEYIVSSNKKSSVRIFAARHQDTDLVEGLIRAAWLANQKHLKCFIDYL